MNNELGNPTCNRFTPKTHTVSLAKSKETKISQFEIQNTSNTDYNQEPLQSQIAHNEHDERKAEYELVDSLRDNIIELHNKGCENLNEHEKQKMLRLLTKYEDLYANLYDEGKTDVRHEPAETSQMSNGTTTQIALSSNTNTENNNRPTRPIKPPDKFGEWC